MLEKRREKEKEMMKEARKGVLEVGDLYFGQDYS